MPEISATKATPTRLVEINEKPTDEAKGCTDFFAILLCLTGVGALVGIPLLFMSGKAIKKTLREGSCPYCSELLNVRPEATGFPCPTCGQRIICRADHFHAFE